MLIGSCRADPDTHLFHAPSVDVPVDLSRVLFVCTANTLDTIPAPLLDRMEVLEVSGYVSEEKTVIAERYLAPQAKEASGLKDADVTLSAEAIDLLIKYYCRESGVRNLKKHIDKVFRKAALRVVRELGETPVTSAAMVAGSSETHTVEDQVPPAPVHSETVIQDASASTDAAPEVHAPQQIVTTEERKPLEVPDTVHLRITPENLKDFVGPPIYHKDRFYTHAPPAGVSTGLGYLGNGSGAVMPVEATVSINCTYVSQMFIDSASYLPEHARKGFTATDWETRRSDSRERADRVKLGQIARV
jgi:Lon-like ATP-dependent protease